MTPGYHYRDRQGRQQWQPNPNSKAKEFCICGCQQVGTKIVHAADGAWLLSERCYEQLLKSLGRR